MTEDKEVDIEIPFYESVAMRSLWSPRIIMLMIILQALCGISAMLVMSKLPVVIMEINKTDKVFQEPADLKRID